MGWGTGNLGGGGTSLNFKVVGGTTRPANPSENTIWVNTDQEITSWVFSANEPENPESGMVWISTGSSSIVAFNALKKNGIYVYPISAKQYIAGGSTSILGEALLGEMVLGSTTSTDSQWVDKTAKTYKNGVWVDWIVWIYDDGKFDSSIATSEKKTPTNASIVYGDKDITLSTVAGKISEVYVVVGPMNIGAISKLVLEGTFVKKTTTTFTNVATIFVAESNNASYKDAVAIATVEMKESLDEGYQYVVELDVSSISGEYYVFSGVNTQGNDWSSQRVNTITTIRGEP